MPRDPRLEAKRDGTTINQPPMQFPPQEHKGHRADSEAWLRGPKKLVRKHAQQRVAAGKATDQEKKLAIKPRREK